MYSGRSQKFLEACLNVSESTMNFKDSSKTSSTTNLRQIKTSIESTSFRYKMLHMKFRCRLLSAPKTNNTNNKNSSNNNRLIPTTHNYCGLLVVLLVPVRKRPPHIGASRFIYCLAFRPFSAHTRTYSSLCVCLLSLARSRS